MEDKKEKQVLSRAGKSGREEGEGGQIWSMYLIYIYDNRIILEIFLRREREKMRGNGGGSESNWGIL
jgi:hypothetical protein